MEIISGWGIHLSVVEEKKGNAAAILWIFHGHDVMDGGNVLMQKLSRRSVIFKVDWIGLKCDFIQIFF